MCVHVRRSVTVNQSWCATPEQKYDFILYELYSCLPLKTHLPVCICVHETKCVSSTLKQACCLNRLPHLSASHLLYMYRGQTVLLKTRKKSLTLYTCLVTQGLGVPSTSPSLQLLLPQQEASFPREELCSSRPPCLHPHTHRAPWSQPPSVCTKLPLWDTMLAAPSAFPLYPLLCFPRNSVPSAPSCFCLTPSFSAFSALCWLSSLPSSLYS